MTGRSQSVLCALMVWLSADAGGSAMYQLPPVTAGLRDPQLVAASVSQGG